MARAIWSGTLAFGLVSVPVKLASAVSPKDVRFHQLHDKDGARIREKRICSAEDVEVPYEHVVKGYELARGRYVVVTPEELAALDPKATRTIEIEDFVDVNQIDPIYFDRTYYLVPDRGGPKPYALLRAAMEELNKVAIARIVLRTKQYLCAVRPIGEALALSTMRWADEVVATDSLELPSSGKPREKELSMAEQLISAMVSDFAPEKYHDDYRERIETLLEKKAAGEAIVTPEAEQAPAKVIDLMDALRASLAAGEKSKATKEAAKEHTKERAKERAKRHSRRRAKAARLRPKTRRA